MAGLWSMVGLVIKSFFTGTDIAGNSTVPETGHAEDPAATCHYVVARFTPSGSDDAGQAALPDPLGDIVGNALSGVVDSKSVGLDYFITVSSDHADRFQAVREAQYGALSLARRNDADVIFWGGRDPASGMLDVHLISDGLASPLYELILPLVHGFAQPDHRDAADALRILLTAVMVLQSRGNEQRALQIARLGSRLEDFQDRIHQGEYFDAAGPGVATAYGFGAYVLAEIGDRAYCASALQVIEPQVRTLLRNVGNQETTPAAVVRKPATTGLLAEGLVQQEAAPQKLKTEELIANISDFSRLSPRDCALLALYGGLVNWSVVSNIQGRSGALAVGLWKLLERRFELMAGSVVDRAVAIGKLGEALVATARDTDSPKLADSGAANFRRALGMLNSNSHAPLYAMVAYHLGDAIVAASQINDVHIPDAQVVPLFEAALKVCSRRDHPYLWARIIFGLGSVCLSMGGQNNDTAMLEQARRSFSQAYDAFIDAGAKGAARAASGYYTRTENLIFQQNHRKAVLQTTGGDQK